MGQLYITVRDWMIALPLGKVELLIYAFVYDLTAKGKFYDGSTEYLASLLSCSVQMVRRALNSLAAEGLITASKGIGRQRAYTACEPPKRETTVSREGKLQFPEKETTVSQKGNHSFPKGKPEFPEKETTVSRPFYKNNSSDNTSDNSSDNTSDSRPTREDVETFCREKGLAHVDRDAFFSHYETRDWRTERGPVKDWRRLLARWDEEAKRKAEKDGGRSYAVTREAVEALQGLPDRKIETKLPF